MLLVDDMLAVAIVVSIFGSNYPFVLIFIHLQLRNGLIIDHFVDLVQNIWFLAISKIIICIRLASNVHSNAVSNAVPPQSTCFNFS